MIKSNNTEMKKIFDIISLDVKRTTFLCKEKEPLHALLLEIAKNFPHVLYYQGMNCIGGFLLLYIKNYSSCLQIFNYLMKTRIEKYFSNSFALLTQLLFVHERFMQDYHPEFHDYIQILNIGTDFYFSPLLLTLFTCSLQTTPLCDFNALVFDIIIADNWFGFMKLFVLISKKILSFIKNRKIEVVIKFLKNDIFKVIQKLDLVQFKKEYNEWHVSKNRFKYLLDEFQRSRFIVEKYWKDYYNKKKDK